MFYLTSIYTHTSISKSGPRVRVWGRGLPSTLASASSGRRCTRSTAPQEMALCRWASQVLV
jgi:hypothetical protein